MTTSPQNRSLRRAAARSGPTRRAGLAALTLAVAALALLGPSSAAPSSSTGAPAAAGAPALPDAVAGPSTLTPEARAEIARVLAEGTTAARLARGAKAQSPAVLAKRLIRCATFEEQRYSEKYSCPFDGTIRMDWVVDIEGTEVEEEKGENEGTVEIVLGKVCGLVTVRGTH